MPIFFRSFTYTNTKAENQNYFSQVRQLDRDLLNRLSSVHPYDGQRITYVPLKTLVCTSSTDTLAPVTQNAPQGEQRRCMGMSVFRPVLWPIVRL